MEPAALTLLSDFFNGTGLESKAGLAAYVITKAANDWPHSAMISVGELLIRSDGSVGMALWSGSRSTANARRTGRAVVLIVLEQQSVRAALNLEFIDSDGRLARFRGRVEDAAAERAPYADLAKGVTFQLHDAPSTLERWAATLATLADG